MSPRDNVAGPSVPLRSRSLLVGGRRRAGLALGWGALFFACLQIGIIVLMECWRPEVRDPETGYKWTLLKERLTAEPGRPLLLVLGTSRTQLGFCPELLPAYRMKSGASPLVFNYGVSATGPIEQLVTLRSLLRAGIRPKWVLLEMLPAHYWRPETSLEGYGKVPRIGWGDLPVLSRYCQRPWLLYLNWCQARLAPGFSQRFFLLDQFAPNWTPQVNRSSWMRDNMDSSGWLLHRQTITTKEYRAGVERARHDYAPLLANLSIARITDRALRDILELCRNEGISIALFLMPEGSEFRSWYSPATTASFNKYLAEVSRRYHVPVINARQWIADTDFMDSHHLLPHGAEVFTRRFGREAIQPLLEGRLSVPAMDFDGDRSQARGGPAPSQRKPTESISR
jgi:hypothetical protein